VANSLPMTMAGLMLVDAETRQHPYSFRTSAGISRSTPIVVIKHTESQGFNIQSHSVRYLIVGWTRWERQSQFRVNNVHFV
jgi:hypothetical protein